MLPFLARPHAAQVRTHSRLVRNSLPGKGRSKGHDPNVCASFESGPQRYSTLGMRPEDQYALLKGMNGTI